MMPPAKTAWTAAFAALTMQAATPAAAKPVFTTFDPPGSQATQASSINSAGVIAGSYEDGASVQHGFIRAADGTFTSFDPPGALYTAVSGINDAGSSIGQFEDNAGLHCFVRTAAGAFNVFDAVPGGLQCYALGINAKAEIVGYEVQNAKVATAFIRNAAGTVKKMKGIDGYPAATAINDAGQAVGSEYAGGQSPAFLRARSGKTTLFDAPGDANGTSAVSINAGGAIAGYFLDSDYQDHSFVRSPGGTITVFDPPGAELSEATGINGGGEITGTYVTNGSYLGFLRSAAGTFRSFGAPAPAIATFPQAINGSGGVVGYYVSNLYREHGFIWTH